MDTVANDKTSGRKMTVDEIREYFEESAKAGRSGPLVWIGRGKKQWILEEIIGDQVVLDGYQPNFPVVPIDRITQRVNANG